jgi:hypothetical protein
MNTARVAIGLVIVSILCTSTLYALTGDGTIPHVLNPPSTSDLTNLPGDLRGVSVLGPSDQDLAEYVKDKQMAIALGKALFWEMQVGSDGVTACASCHFSSGMADTRSKNQLSPGLKRITPTGAPNPDTTFHRNLGPVGQVTGSDFPFFPVSNDVLSSQGVRNSVFLGIGNGPADRVRQEPDPDGFRVGSTNTRRVEPRNTPTVINAVINHRQFWDGRADNVFNGVNEMGDRDPSARVFRADSPTNPVPIQIRLEDSSLASQAVVPPVSGDEMSARGRTMRDIGKKFARYQIPGRPPIFVRWPSSLSIRRTACSVP